MNKPKECDDSCFYATCRCGHTTSVAPVEGEPYGPSLALEALDLAIKRAVRRKHGVSLPWHVATAMHTHFSDAIAQLRERETVTKAEAFSADQIDAGIQAVEALRIMRMVWTPEDKRDAFFTAARGVKP